MNIYLKQYQSMSCTCFNSFKDPHIKNNKKKSCWKTTTSKTIWIKSFSDLLCQTTDARNIWVNTGDGLGHWQLCLCSVLGRSGSRKDPGSEGLQKAFKDPWLTRGKGMQCFKRWLQPSAPIKYQPYGQVSVLIYLQAFQDISSNPTISMREQCLTKCSVFLYYPLFSASKCNAFSVCKQPCLLS